MLAFQLAERFGEIDPRKVTQLPADILLHWQAYFKISAGAISTPDPETPAVSDIDAQCAAVMRVLS